MFNYQEIYLKLLSLKQFDRLEKLMKEQNVHDSLRVSKSSLETKEGFPYILLKIESDQVFAAQMIGLSLQIHELLPEYTDDYYLPVIAIHEYRDDLLAMANGYNSTINNLIDQENAIKHELIHIKDILSLINKDPSYLKRIMLYSIHKIESSQYLPESVDIEVFKIFYLEPQALGNDFNQGEKTIRIVLLGELMEYNCKTSEEYIEMLISDYLEDLSMDYKKKFPNDTEFITNQMDVSIIKYGKEVFGKNPLERLKKIGEEYSSKMLSGFIEKTKRLQN
jgi:hypothetical protein